MRGPHPPLPPLLMAILITAAAAAFLSASPSCAAAAAAEGGSSPQPTRQLDSSVRLPFPPTLSDAQCRLPSASQTSTTASAVSAATASSRSSSQAAAAAAEHDALSSQSPVRVLVGFPKSGTTYIAQLIGRSILEYLSGEDIPPNLFNFTDEHFFENKLVPFSRHGYDRFFPPPHTLTPTQSRVVQSLPLFNHGVNGQRIWRSLRHVCTLEHESLSDLLVDWRPLIEAHTRYRAVLIFRHPHDTAVSALHYYQGRVKFPLVLPYTNCTIRYLSDTIRTFSSLDNIEWMPLVYEDVIRSPVAQISNVLRFYEFEAKRAEEAVRRVIEIDPLEWKAVRRVFRQASGAVHTHDDEQPLSPHNTRVVQLWYSELIRAAHLCSSS
mmetsp:Transcript_5986/g.15201  ORF Transcript_5986/g.15201 Transcript_5986/m.15201 type:complete len:380 (+) Transcript_5986:106-1245(+)|eukprot:CAMPEP_0177664684 /NCGR_PEP_ID=MMETSP0447-20121125/20638_1 /TAXON_ID=0 /ORGANISM="Stygamoeba regulata, Strain BSH-02190019" /LENGTH=379 /DNA_ID=CAMNT_0019170699 /DNA_START=111 /DNA_END=1250 /DNA_ORIENTATION=+